MAGGMRENFIPWTSFHVTCTPRSSSFLISSPVDPPLTSRHPLVPPSGGQGLPAHFVQPSALSFVSRQQASCLAPGLGKTLIPVLATAPPQTAVALSGHPGTGFATIATPLAALAAGAGEGRGTLVSFDTVGSDHLWRQTRVVIPFARTSMTPDLGPDLLRSCEEGGPDQPAGRSMSQPAQAAAGPRVPRTLAGQRHHHDAQQLRGGSLVRFEAASLVPCPRSG